MKTPAPAISASSRLWINLVTALSLLPLLLQLPGVLAALFGITTLSVALWSWRRAMPLLLRLLLIGVMLACIYWQMGANPGRDNGCALLAAMLAIKSSELRTLRDARSLIGFSLFAPFAAFLLDQGPSTLLMSAAAVIAALLALQRLADEEVGIAHLPPRAQLRTVGGLMLLALPLALSAFWLVPRLPTPLWGTPDRVVGRPGLSDSMQPGGLSDMMADDSPALRVEFFGPVPAQDQRYWRGPVLTRFDGRRWSRVQSQRAAPPPHVSNTALRWDYQIEYESTDQRELVALDLPLQAPAGSQLDADYSLTSARPLTALTRWRMRSSPAQAFQAELPARLRRQALQLPEGFNPRTLALARQWRSQAGTDDAALVQRSVDWIHREFAYTLNTPVPGRHSVDEFLFDQKAGYCEHFSAAFVVLMRGAGIPARVVTGYAGGVRNRFGNYWVVRRLDAHAWAEVWLPQRGWVRVDPTAAVAPERIYDTIEDRIDDNETRGMDLSGRWSSLLQYSDFLRRGWNTAVLSFDAERQQRLLSGFGIKQLSPSQLVALFAGFAVLALGLMAWLLARGERQRDPLLRAWHRMGRRYQRLGLGREPFETASDWASRVDRARPSSDLLTLSQRFTQARYAGVRSDVVSLLADLHRHRPKPGVRT
ncbi:DUF3488 and transglutaminase-like domain-containing protein [uncultured Stenotrophomonas sp.]|uniref:transglutaminase TgpA family protein n=1 Tax=uncultured Stenotrophomonas sp. TaxID=165438 RepID=UPI0025D160B6|nr:DUF3488 and transglutaminase-like domain-containing protein [uncultured Stenotrophomonas sp.]